MKKSNIHLNKWYLDFVGDNGEALIGYSAKLTWHGFTANYTSLIHKVPGEDVKLSTHFRKSQLPLKKDGIITWKDNKLEVSGSWEATAKSIENRIYDSENGYLDWKCYQPASRVKLKIKGSLLEGSGYAEQLVLTALPWNIPMNHLRWGRFHSSNNTLVWIELKEKDKKQWLWLNGESIPDGIIENDRILSREENFQLILDRKIVLESEKKIYQVVQILLKFLPGFNKIMPVKFLMADNHKWLSKGEFQKGSSGIENGMAIHEWVNFNPESL
ncbi:hypothetical protein G3I01_03800 [Gramella sp. MT6]|uniref:hypothetical protein n=1 Tax=Gramella sp. MT6 TaxID=2705471 RepID=UPI001C5ECF49|nr:hypothetical protein [Gramella sp. MT6]QYA24668.1 hypothetical protein G3I01_03800 [Gramella sp. MT6]